jgi:hypothetical protein
VSAFVSSSEHGRASSPFSFEEIILPEKRSVFETWSTRPDHRRLSRQSSLVFRATN